MDILIANDLEKYMDGAVPRRDDLGQLFFTSLCVCVSLDVIIYYLQQEAPSTAR